MPITAEPRSTRYLILVDGEVAQANARWEDALKRAAIIARTWTSAQVVEAVDSWGIHARITYRA